ncbi:MAG: tyrosine recombinase XerC, partial [Piscirickettsiaceae bacterium]|nr:tyrosine recombinase XerC [Piscirickettsiaceae bacterium]
MANKLTQDIEHFLQYLTQEKRMSSHTVTNYQRDLKQLVAFCEPQDLTNWSAIKSSHIRQFIAQLNRQGLAGRSIQRSLSAIRSLYRFLIREQLADNNPAQAVQAPKAEKRLPATLDVDQMNSLLDNSRQKNSVISSRDHAMMELFYSSGLRLAELASLNCRDVDFGDQLVYVTGKGNKSRVIPVGKIAIAALKNWLEQREQWGFFEQTALFITQKGQRLGVRSIQKRLRYWGKKQGISDRVYPHRLRHAFASHM